jgi:thiamine biosynthesis lipoprotein
MTHVQAKPGRSDASSRTIHHREHVMGTVIIFDIAIDDDVDTLDAFIGLERAVTSLHRADSVFSTWESDSPVSRLRRGEITTEQAPPEVDEVLKACTVAKHMSRGWFDPWAMPGGVDPTGFVKGWAAQRALDELRTTSATSAMVNAAGDIATFGRSETDALFRIGIVNPRAPQTLASIVEIRGAIATSGSYERGNHLVDPRSGLCRSRALSASVAGPDLGTADAFATGLAVAGEEGLAFVEAYEGYEGLIMCNDGTWKWTAGFPFASDGPRMSGGPISLMTS